MKKDVHEQLSNALKNLFVATLWTGLLVSPRSAQADIGWREIREQGFRIDSRDDALHLEFGGRLQADFALADADSEIESRFGEDAFHEDFELRRARLFLEGLIYDRVKFKAQYDLASGDAVAKDVYIGLVSDWGTVTLGHHIEPFSLEGMTSSKYIAFVERATPVEVFSPARNSGISASGLLADKATWGVGVFYDSNDFGAGVDEGRYNLTGRMVFRPLYKDDGKRMVHVGLGITNKEIEAGGSLRLRGRSGVHSGPRLIDTGDIRADSAFSTPWSWPESATGPGFRESISMQRSTARE